LRKKARVAPVTLTYQASFWCHTDFDLRYAFSEFVWDTDNKTILKPSVEVDGYEIPFPAHLSYDDLSFEPEYNEQDWLERNKIHSASIGFEIETLAIKINENVYIPEYVLFNFAYGKGAEPETVEESYEFLISELSET
jgi:hypothetical protein